MSRALMSSPRPRLARWPAALAAGLLLAGCATAPDWKAPPADQALAQAAVPTRLPAAAGAADVAPALPWEQVVTSPRLRGWVTQALAHNRDLRVAAANVQRARAQLSATDANRLPTVGAGLNASRSPDSKGEQANTLTAGVQLASWELDLFGRLANLSEAAFAQWLATSQAQRATELSVVAAVLQASLALQADDELLALARQTLASREQTLKLVQLRESAGAASQLELQAQLGLVAQARATLAQLERQQAQDTNALALLLGGPVQAAPAAAGTALAGDAWLAEVPAGLSSAVLLRRPDVMQAESALRAADANIAAARAAFLPSISLTGQAGQVSPQLSGLFQGGNFAYTAAANLALTVFDGGRRQANLESAQAARVAAQAQYERAIQAAFRETADALAGGATWRNQREALELQRSAARETARLTTLRAEQGAASTLELLEAQRSLFAAEQAVLQARLGELNNRVALFKALAG
ncbi:efflux transporter outer membrane subunit [Pseudaquabacterium pictum]|uniref:Multidrug transporter n=1 Tax=Pseudaquabacterium pictum TaxID=2315236 RepID=A0A480AXK4_9BURK|nr:efflux transporter outer membrane subunit [Rubrivivax pictus]GCL66041.1 multidrug transporter [Rubrivivax pictus]